MTNQIVTPVGVAHYPNVNEPNYTFKEEGEFKCDLIVSEEDAAVFEQQIRNIMQKDYEIELAKTGKKIRMAQAFPVYQDEDGQWVIRAKQKAKVRAKNGKEYDFSIKIFDSSNKLTDSRIGSGSKLRMAVEPRTWSSPLGFGITLNLKAVQVLELVEYDPAANTIFDSVDGGYVSEAETFDSAFESEPLVSSKGKNSKKNNDDF